MSMNVIKSELRSFFWATVDFLMAFGGLVFVLYPAVTFGNRILGTPLDDTTRLLLIGVLAFGGAYPFVAGDWRLGTLGEYIFALTVSTIAVGIIGATVVISLELTVSGSNPMPQVQLFASAYVLAAFLVYRFGHARAPAADVS